MQNRHHAERRRLVSPVAVPDVPIGRPPRHCVPAGARIRLCATTDAEALWTLFEGEDYRRSGTLLERFAAPADVAAWFEANRIGNFQIVALAAGAVVGFAGLYPLRGRQSHVGTMSLGVLEAFQGRGFGSLLLRSILSTADHLAGLSRLQLQVVADNASAIALYQAFGFSVEGHHARFVRRDTPHGPEYADALAMARIYDAASAPPAPVPPR